MYNTCTWYYFRFSVTAQLRKYDAAIMELGVTYDSRQSIPPHSDKFYLEGVCAERCSDRVGITYRLEAKLNSSTVSEIGAAVKVADAILVDEVRCPIKAGVFS